MTGWSTSVIDPERLGDLMQELLDARVLPFTAHVTRALDATITFPDTTAAHLIVARYAPAARIDLLQADA